MSKIKGVRSAIAQLRKGIPGRGPYRGLIFRVSGVSDEAAERAAQYLKFDRHVLTFHRPIDYAAAWNRGYVTKSISAPQSSMSTLLAERTAESYARVFAVARSAAANLTTAKDVESALRLLEVGVSGQGIHAESVFKIVAPRKNVRFQAKKMLRFHDGDLFFIPSGLREDDVAVSEIIERERPAKLAQNVVALYNTAKSVGADFGSAVTPADVITSLRTGVHATNQLGCSSSGSPSAARSPSGNGPLPTSGSRMAHCGTPHPSPSPRIA